MSDASKQDPSTFDPDEDLFNFDEVALEFYSANDEEDLEEIFRAFEEGLDSDDDLGFDLDDNVVGGDMLGLDDELVEEPETVSAESPLAEASTDDPAPVEDPKPADVAPVESFRADPAPTPPPAPTHAEQPIPAPQPQEPAPVAPTPAPVASQPAAAPTPSPELPSSHPAPNVLPPQVYPSPISASAGSQHEAPSTGSDLASRYLAVLRRLRTASPILLAVTVMNLLLAVVVLNRPSTPERNYEPLTPQYTPEVVPQYDLPKKGPAQFSVPQPDRHPTFALAHEEISRGEYGKARRRIYGLLSIVDRLSIEERAEIESRAHYLLAEAQHLEALARMEARK